MRKIKPSTMFPIKKIHIKTAKNTTELFSTFNWHAHPVKYVWMAETKRSRCSTDRPFIGKIDEKSSSFLLTRNRSYFEAMAPRVIIKGKVIKNESGNSIEIKFFPGLYTLVVLFSMVLMLVYMGINNLVPIEKSAIMELIVSFLILLVLLFSLTLWEVQKTKNAITRMIKLL